MSSIQFYPDASELDAQIQQQMAVIFVQNFTAAPRYEEWTHQTALDYLQSLWNKGAQTWVFSSNHTVSDNIILGFAIGIVINEVTQSHDSKLLTDYPDAFYLEEIAVSLSTQGQGIGKQLMHNTLTDIQQLSYPSYVTRVRSDIPAMIQLLQKSGFTQVDSYLASKGGVSFQRLIYQYSFS